MYSAFDKKWKASKRGRPELLTSKQVNLLARTAKAMIQKAAGKREDRKLLLQQAYSVVLSALQSAEVQPVVRTTMMLSWGIATPSIQQLYHNYITTIQQPI